jgi:hypothetical protein
MMLQRTLGDSHIIAPYPAQCNRTINPHWEIIPVYFLLFLVLVFKKGFKMGIAFGFPYISHL